MADHGQVAESALFRTAESLFIIHCRLEAHLLDAQCTTTFLTLWISLSGLDEGLGTYMIAAKFLRHITLR